MNKLKSILTFSFFLFYLSCEEKLNKEDKIFHAGPNESGLSATFFSLYKNYKYEFCDGNFLNDGCYTGNYSLKGDTIILKKLKLNKRVRSNRFLICRYEDQDSTYWINKYSHSKLNWRELKERDILMGSEGDVFELNEFNKPNITARYYYVIRKDNL